MALRGPRERKNPVRNVTVAKPKDPQAKGKGTGAKGPTPTATEEPGSTAPPVGKQLTSYDIFELCITRARNLIQLHKDAHGKAGKPPPYASDAHRAAIVLAVSALDAFVRDFVITRTLELLSSQSRELPEPLAQKVKKLIGEDELLKAARLGDLQERVEKAIRQSFEYQSFQGTRAIERELKLAGYENIFHTIAVNENLNEEKLRKDLDRFTSRRHAVAHRGDYDLTENPPPEQTITKTEATECIKLVSRIAKQMQKIGDEE